MGESKRAVKYARSEAPKYSIVFGRTTHSRSEKNNRSKILRFLQRSPQFATLQRLQRKSTQVVENDCSHPSRKMPSLQEDKVKGRQIMSSKQDYAKAKEKRKRQMTYASQLKASRKNHVSIQISSITRIVVQSFRKLIDCERCALFLMDHSTNELYFKPVGDEHSAKEIRFPASAGVAGWVATKREPLNIKNAYHDFRFNTEIDKKTSFRTRSILCAPVLSTNGNLFGVIQMINKKKGDSKTIQNMAKKKKSNWEHHGYESCYEPFSDQDEEIIDRCSAEVSKALEPIIAPKDWLESKTTEEGRRGRRRSSTGIDLIDCNGLVSSNTAGRRRSSVGNLAQFANKSHLAQPINKEPAGGIFGQEVSSVSEALTKFQFRKIGGPQMTSRGQNKDNPDHILAASKRKRMADYNHQRKTIIQLRCENQGNT